MDTGRTPRGPGPAPTPQRRAEAVDAGADAALAAAVLALDPPAFGGAVLRGPAGPAREAWLAALRALAPPAMPWRRVPSTVDDERLLGGRDLAATLRGGQTVWQRGLLAEADGGVVLLPGAERMGPALAGRLARALDLGQVDGPREAPEPARIACLACDESTVDDGEVSDGHVAGGDDAGPLAGLPAALAERLAFHLRLDALRDGGGADTRAALEGRWVWPTAVDPAAVDAARTRWRTLPAAPALLEALCAAAQALGLDDLRLPWWALQAARGAAALAGQDRVDEASVRWAVRVVYAGRARCCPAPAAPESADPPSADSAEPAQPPEGGPDRADAPPPPDPRADDTQRDAPPSSAAADPPADPPADPATATVPDAEAVLDAVRAALPPGLLARLAAAALVPAPRAGRGGAARAGGRSASAGRGRALPARPGRPHGGAALALVQTLQAAAPWQAWRRRQAASPAAPGVRVALDDLRVRRREPRRVATTLFLVDASGSAAMHRLAEAKGAVEQLLADCYVRRDQVAVLAFRGTAATTLLPPTRSLARARRSLAGLPGGGGTPLASGLDAAHALASRLLRDGGLPLLVLLTDGRANIARDGTPGRAGADADALLAARAWRLLGVPALVVDTAPRRAGMAGGADPAARLALAMGARCLPLPPSPAALSRQVQQLQGAPGSGPARAFGP